MQRQRKTKATLDVLQAILATEGRIYGYPLTKKADRRAGTVYPILYRLLEDGWLGDGWDDPEDTYPRRRYYVVTELGRQEIPKLIASYSVQT